MALQFPFCRFSIHDITSKGAMTNQKEVHGYLSCPGCGKDHPIWEATPLLAEGNSYKCMSSGTLVKYDANQLRDAPTATDGSNGGD